MKLVLFIISMFLFLKGSTQANGTEKQKSLEDFKKKGLTPQYPQKDLLQKGKPGTPGNPYVMPSVRPRLTRKFLGNNGNGADVYAIMPYNMPCIMPDSTFRANTPVVGGKMVKPN